MRRLRVAVFFGGIPGTNNSEAYLHCNAYATHINGPHTLTQYCHVSYIVHMSFGDYIRQIREQLRESDKRYSVRQTAQRIGVEPAYLSKIERGDVAPPSEATIRRLAQDLGVDVDVLLAMAGKVSSDLREIIMRRPRLFAELIRQLKDTPDHAVLRIVREVRDGDW